MNRLLNRLSTLFLLCLATLSLIYLIADSFNCYTDPSLLIWLLASCLLLWMRRTGFMTRILSCS